MLAAIGSINGHPFEMDVTSSGITFSGEYGGDIVGGVNDFKARNRMGASAQIDADVNLVSQAGAHEHVQIHGLLSCVKRWFARALLGLASLGLPLRQQVAQRVRMVRSRF